MTWDDVVEMAGVLPEVEESTSYGTPALKVKGKGFARLRTEAEGGLVLMCRLDEKQALLASRDPAIFTTPHYDGSAIVLVNLAAIDVDELRELITESWRLKAPPKVLQRYEASL